jgi:hypothetical protein
MKRIVRLYPAAWRERYGDEMEALLEERPLGPFDLVDLFLGALDAHMHLRGLGHASEHEKGITMSLRTAGIAAIVGGSFWGLTWALILLNDLVGTGDGNVPVAFLTISVAAIATLAALAGLSAVQARVHRRATWLSFLAPAVGLVLVLVGFMGMAAIELFWAIGMIGLLLYLVGVAVFGIVTYATGVFRRLPSALIAAGGVVSGVAFLGLLGTGGTDVPMWVAVLGVLVMSVGWILIGVEAVRRDGVPTPTSQPAT